MGPPAACLFDLDGLLLDTEPLHGRAWREAACHFGGDLSETQLLDLRGRPRLDCAERGRCMLPQPGSVEALLAVRQPIAEALLGQAPDTDAGLDGWAPRHWKHLNRRYARFLHLLLALVEGEAQLPATLRKAKAVFTVKPTTKGDNPFTFRTLTMLPYAYRV